MAKTRASGSAATSSPGFQLEYSKFAKLAKLDCKAKGAKPPRKKATSGSKTKGQQSKQSSGGKTSLEKKAQKIFKCPVCLTLPLCDIYQCKGGHLVCMDCYKKLRSPISCPTCRTAMPNDPIRKRAAEQVKVTIVIDTEASPYKVHSFVQENLPLLILI